MGYVGSRRKKLKGFLYGHASYIWFIQGLGCKGLGFGGFTSSFLQGFALPLL